MQVSHEEAKVRMAHEPYKLELVRDILAKDPDAKITLYHIGAPARTYNNPTDDNGFSAWQG